jgi:murein DD-endopeptidase MepM/ murein hydrolase activator NlpD
MNKLILFSVFTIISAFFLFSRGEWENKHILFYKILSSNPEPAYPVDEFKKRITKKNFGLFISPGKSPVKPERFTGYHTGVDVEYQDIKSDIPVYAIADGTVVFSKIVSGYGGVFIIEIKLKSLSYTILYGHIRPASLPENGQKVYKGEKLALLGTGYSVETDGERRHLHFSVLPGNHIDLRGYVQRKNQLSGWIDPLTLYR